MIAKICPNGAKYKRLGDVWTIKKGKDYKHLGTGNIPVFGSSDTMGVKVDEAAYDKPTALLPRKDSVSNVFYVDEPFWNVDTNPTGIDPSRKPQVTLAEAPQTQAESAS